MNVIPILRFVSTAALALAAVGPLLAQQTPAPAPRPVARLVVEPASVEVLAGQTVPVRLIAYDAGGAVIEQPSLRISGARGGIGVSNAGIRGIRAGTYELVVTSVSADSTVKPVSITVPVTVKWPPVNRIDLATDPAHPNARDELRTSTRATNSERRCARTIATCAVET